MFLHMPLQALCVEKGGYACTACNLLGRLQLFDPFPFPPVRFTIGMSGSLKLNDVHNRIPYVRGGILFTSNWRLLVFHFWIPFPPLRFTCRLSGSLKLNDVHNRIRYVRGGILLQHGEFGIPPQGLQEVTLNPTGEGYLSDWSCVPSTQASDLYCSSKHKVPPAYFGNPSTTLKGLRKPKPPDPTLKPKP